MATTEDTTGVSFSEKKAARDEVSSFLADVEAGTEAQWESVVVPEWSNRTVWVRGLNVGERAKLRRDGYVVSTDERGEKTLRETPESDCILLIAACHVDVNGQKIRLFKDDPQHRALIKRQRGGVLDKLITTALKLSGLLDEEKKTEADFLASLNNGSDSDWPET